MSSSTVALTTCYITHHNQWDAVGKMFNIKINYVTPVWESNLHCYEVCANIVM
jgi:hypothetical protein